MESRLHLATGFKGGRTVIEDMYFTPPYKIMSPFMDGAHMDVMLMSASAGMLGGDSFTFDFEFGEKSDVTILSQSYEKVFQAKNGVTKKNVRINAAARANIKYRPFPVIPFAGCDFEGNNTIKLAESARLIYIDVFSCGRVGMGEVFRMKRYRSITRVYVEDMLVFADHNLVLPNRFQYDKMGMWDKYTHSGLMYLYIPDKKEEGEVLAQIRSLSENTNCAVGASLALRGIAVRALAMSGDKIWRLFEKISDAV